ncbi:hypothetical protein ON010_g4797 [Phytophthora cinnamomi]|nr:hypothetical protein ON010_g4797 [Phytophthora cinnamomi]
MRPSLFLVFAVITLLAYLDISSGTRGVHQPTQQQLISPDLHQSIDPIQNGDDREHTLLRSTRTADDADNNTPVNKERRISITDPAILANLAKFDDWVGQGKTAEKVYKELGLKLSWKIAYQTGRWKQFLFDEPEYLLFRKYVKYLKLIGREDP